MELAISDGSESLFDDYVEQVEDAPLDPRLRAYFLFFKAQGVRRFGRSGFKEQLIVAREYASHHHFHQIAFEVEAAMEQVPTRLETSVDDDLPRPVEGSQRELQRIAEVLIHLRDELSARAER